MGRDVAAAIFFTVLLISSRHDCTGLEILLNVMEKGSGVWEKLTSFIVGYLIAV
jgi:hypothetical protein